MNLSNPQTLSAFLAKYGIRAEKGLGQHFLCSSSVVEAIVGAVSESRGILEIGPGPGVLTSILSERLEKVVAVEVDPRMVQLLKESAPRAEVRLEDALNADLNAILEELPEPRSIVGNLPYYITGPLLTRIAGVRKSIETAVVMIQKEVAQRVAAPPRDSNRGSLSVFLQAQFEVRILKQAPAAAFLPPPKVDSTVLELRTLPSEPSPELLKMVRLSFSQPRKTLLNNLVAGYRVNRSQAAGWIAQAGLREDVRPHLLSMTEWENLSRCLSAES
ncbi:MAG TPA: 16S rRNA (adenine(1518)-N(6)/adenine(1519)-N(6))-dimethyltransferase RsmA [Fimbriimonas sp.]|nr:16S rRNA (adenine(1518)-N(6)/adenine(1519)-N(6))-dimethyltransferase RsmA [Fimbriimonas sp.]